MTNNPRLATILNDPASFTFPLTLRNGERVTFRPLQKADAQRLGDYFLAISADLRSRFAPHAFTREMAQELCDQLAQGDMARLIVVTEANQEVIAYYLLDFALHESDQQRYLSYGIPLDASTDCRFAPSVLDRYQHGGLGTMLMARCKQIASQMGCQRMILIGGVLAWNEKALPYYEKSGFRKVGTFDVGTPIESYDMILTLPTYQRFTGNLSARHCKRHLPHSFEMPANCTQLDIQLHFEPFRVHGKENMITLTLFDPTGFRGAGHRGGNHHEVRITRDRATPGYLAGSLPAGTWIAQLDTHMIMPGEPIHYQLEITCSELPTGATLSQPPAQTQPAKITPRGPGWYRGDLHSHTHHSDGSRSVSELLQTARDYKLDFIFLTDHNTVSPLAEIDASATDDLFTAGGLELTTFFGHALCLGTREWVDWRVRPATGEMPEIATATYDQQQLFIIAHPEAIGDPTCTGCRWRYGDMMPGTAQVVEIWNGPWGGDSYNEQALSLWYDWLNQGARLVATAGSDTHATSDYAAGPGFNVIYAEELSEAGLLKAIGAGHLFLSSGPRLHLTARSAQGQTWLMGDWVDQPVTFVADWADCPSGALVRVIANGRLMTEVGTGGAGRREWQAAPDQAAWVLVEVRAVTGEILAITNPIFMG